MKLDEDQIRCLQEILVTDFSDIQQLAQNLLDDAKDLGSVEVDEKAQEIFDFFQNYANYIDDEFCLGNEQSY